MIVDGASQEEIKPIGKDSKHTVDLNGVTRRKRDMKEKRGGAL